MLSKYNFEIIDLEYASLDFQIKLFSQASVVVAPTGATLTNMLFCQPRTKVIIFMSNHETTNHYFWSYLGNIARLALTTIVGERLFNLTNYHSVHDDYVIDSNVLLEEIKKIEQQ
jgi:capsular polysaccharide biosynthesis protein